MRNNTYISVSQINTYLNCPQQYYRRYIEKDIPSNDTKQESLILGSAIHSYLENYVSFKKISNPNEIFYNHLNKTIGEGKIKTKKPIVEDSYEKLLFGSDTKDADYINYFLDMLSDEDAQLYISGYEEELKTKTVHRPSILELYGNIVEKIKENISYLMTYLEITETEKKVIYNGVYEDEPFEVLSYFDAIGKNKGNGKPIVIDWKVTKKAWSADDSVKKQDIIYSFLTKELFKEIPEFYYCIFSYSDKTGNVNFQIIKVEHDEASISLADKDIIEILTAKQSGVFPKNEGSYLCSIDYCEFYRDCQGYKAGVKVKEIDFGNVIKEITA